LRGVIESGEPLLGFEMSLPGPAPRHFLAHYVPVATDGDVRGVLAVVEDITHLRDVQRRAAESERRLETLVEAGVVGVVVADADDILEANDAFLAMLGDSRARFEAEGLSWREITPPEWAEVDRVALADLGARGSCEPFEKEYYRRDGSRVPILVVAATVWPDPLRVLAV